MKKLFGMLLAVLIVFCIAGSASAKPFKHCDGKEWQPPKMKPINIDDVKKNGADICFDLKHKKKRHKKKKDKKEKDQLKGPRSCDFESIFKKDGEKIELRVCQTSPPSNHAPEPATLLLFGAGLAGIGVFGKRFRKL
jgi:hypothetical protein